jgi:hypothetical protein
LSLYGIQPVVGVELLPLSFTYRRDLIALIIAGHEIGSILRTIGRGAQKIDKLRARGVCKKLKNDVDKELRKRVNKTRNRVIKYLEGNRNVVLAQFDFFNGIEVRTNCI